MLSQVRPTLVVFATLTLITGVAYPLAVTAVGLVFFRHEARGSLIEIDGRPVGSELIGQGFAGPRYFWGRPSAAGYNGAASTGSNLGPTNPAQLEAVKGRIAAMQAASGNEKKVPIDLVTASGSGLDPHLSPAAIDYQLERVAKERRMTHDSVEKLIAECTEGRTVGVLGEPTVNVLKLNLALDAAQPAE